VPVGEVAFVDRGDPGDAAAAAAAARGIRLAVGPRPAAKRGFVPLPRRWVAERSTAWLARCRRLARAAERLPGTLKGLHLPSPSPSCCSPASPPP
jgi:transposase